MSAPDVINNKILEYVKTGRESPKELEQDIFPIVEESSQKSSEPKSSESQSSESQSMSQGPESDAASIGNSSNCSSKSTPKSPGSGIGSGLGSSDTHSPGSLTSSGGGKFKEGTPSSHGGILSNSKF